MCAGLTEKFRPTLVREPCLTVVPDVHVLRDFFTEPSDREGAAKFELRFLKVFSTLRLRPANRPRDGGALRGKQNTCGGIPPLFILGQTTDYAASMGLGHDRPGQKRERRAHRDG